MESSRLRAKGLAMFECQQSNVSPIRPLQAEGILHNLRSLREQITVAWSERAVMLSREEQDALHAEIVQTCSFLADLTASHKPATNSRKGRSPA